MHVQLATLCSNANVVNGGLDIEQTLCAIAIPDIPANEPIRLMFAASIVFGPDEAGMHHFEILGAVAGVGPAQRVIDGTLPAPGPTTLIPWSISHLLQVITISELATPRYVTFVLKLDGVQCAEVPLAILPESGEPTRELRRGRDQSR